MALEPITYACGDRSYTGYLAMPAGDGAVPGVLVVHEAGGLTDHAKGRAEMLADLGYAAFAMDVFGVVDPPLEEARKMVMALRADRAEFRGRARAALDVLGAHAQVDAARLAGVGFCFGGTAVFELARVGAPILGAVGFHAGLDALAPGEGETAETAPIRARVLALMGADDPIIAAPQRAAFADEMTAREADWELHLYGGVGHSFTNRDAANWGFDGFAYHAEADRRAWRAMRGFLGDVFEG